MLTAFGDGLCTLSGVEVSGERCGFNNRHVWIFEIVDDFLASYLEDLEVYFEECVSYTLKAHRT